MACSSWQKIKNLISFAYLRFSISPDSTVFPDSSPPSPPSISSPDLKPPLVSHQADNTAIEISPSSTASTACGDALLVETKDFKRVGKMAYNATLGVIAISVMMLVKIPQPIDPGWCTLCAYEAAFACSSLILSIGLAYYSIMNPVGEKLAWVQVRVMACYGLLVILAVFSHMAAMFPLFHFLKMLLAIVVIGLVILCLYLVWGKDKKTQ